MIECKKKNYDMVSHREKTKKTCMDRIHRMMREIGLTVEDRRDRVNLWYKIPIRI